MKSFIQYLEESVKENVYAIKFAMQPTDDQFDTVESFLKKHDLISISKPEHVEHDKMDFYDIPNKNIWQIRAVTGMPLSPYIIMQQLKAVLNIPEDYIVVRGANEPVELESNDTAFEHDMDDMAADKSLMPAARLSTDRFYNDAEEPILTDVFGNDYNKKLLDYLRSVADDRQTDHYEAPAPLFSWIDMDKVMDEQAVESHDFNERFDTPKPVNKGAGKDVPPVDPINLGHHGNFDDGAAQKIKLMKDSKGKRESVSAPRASLKAEKVR